MNVVDMTLENYLCHWKKKKYFNSKKIRTRSYLYEFVNKKDRNQSYEGFDGVLIVFD